MSSITKLYQRRNSNKITPKPTPQPTMIPYRDDKGQLQYATALPAHTQQSPYDSDGEPLIPASSRHYGPNLDDDAIQRFTATGRPIPAYGHSALHSWGVDMFAMPQYLPRQYTDDSIIPAIVTDVIPNPKPLNENEESGGKRRKSFVKMLKGDRSPKEEDGKGITKVVFMPRREYLKRFAKDDKGVYCGSEPFKRWTEQELDELYGEYRPKKLTNKSKSHSLTASLVSAYRS